MPQPFTFAFAPTVKRNPAESAQHGAPLQRYLEQALARPVQLIVPESYADSLAALRDGRVDAAMLGELAMRQGQASGAIEPLVAPAGGDQQPATYTSVIVTRLDSGIHDLADLRGMEFGLVDEQSTSGYLVPRAMLREAGLDPDTDLRPRLLGRHRFVVEQVISGELVAGAVHESQLTPRSLDRGPDLARLRVLARSHPIPLGPLVIRSTLDAATREVLLRSLLRIHEADPQAAAILIRGGLRFTRAEPRSVPTLRSIAALAGVSYGTVSRFVNKTGYVAPGTAARLAAIINEVGYVPNGNARALQGQLAPLVGFLLLPREHSLSPSWLATGERLHEQMASAGIPLVWCPAIGPLGENLALQLVRDRRIAALIIGEPHVADQELVALARTGHRIVAVDVPVASGGMLRASLGNAAATVISALGWNAAAASGSASVSSIDL
jgi:phosphonate transport system substrate-binding protein